MTNAQRKRKLWRHLGYGKIFEPSKNLTRHPLDAPFACGFDPDGVSIWNYVGHIRTCKNIECYKSSLRWEALKKEFANR